MRRLEHGVWWMSRQAIAAVLARSDLAAGERLVALSLASFAGRENRAWPGAATASARAGLSRSRYQQARERLIARGLLVVEERATGRGRASTVRLVFADSGPWWDGEINVELFEAVLSCSTGRGSARLLLATMAAVADECCDIRDLSTERLCAAAGIADRTYRRARAALLASGQLELLSGAGGRGNMNVWKVLDPREVGAARAARIPRRVPPPVRAQPLVAPAGRSVSKGGHDRTVLEAAPPESPAQTPAKTPALHARAGTKSLNPRIGERPPNPPQGGTAPDSILVEQTYVTDRGRRRRRPVRVDLDEVRRGLGRPTAKDRSDWQRIRVLLEQAVGESAFEIWIAPAELIAVDAEQRLVIAVPAVTAAWMTQRYGRVLGARAEHAGRELRIAADLEVRALAARERDIQERRQEVAG
jgi:hypothetical protein